MKASQEKEEPSTEKLWVHMNMKPWPPRLSVKARRRERPPSTSLPAGNENGEKKKKKKTWEVGAPVLCMCVWVPERGRGSTRHCWWNLLPGDLSLDCCRRRRTDRVPCAKAERRPPKKRRHPRNSRSARDCIRAQFVFIHPCFVAFDFQEPRRVQLCPYNFLRLSGARPVNPFLRRKQWHCSSE